MPERATLNYTTTVSVSRTVAEVQGLLAAAGADAVLVRYTDREPVAVSFVLRTPHGERSFTLPVNAAGVHRILLAKAAAGQFSRAGKKAAYSAPEHAARVAWRVAKDWLEAQLALIEAEMATLDQVMLPYLHVGYHDGREISLYDRFLENEQRALTAGGSDG